MCNKYNCSSKSKRKYLHISVITPIMATLKVNSRVAQTLACKISGLIEPVAVTWEDIDWNDITNGERGYTVSQGTVNDDGVQETTLKISPDRVDQVALAIREDGDTSTFYTCRAKSTEYPLSPNTRDVVKIEFLDFGKYLKFYIQFTSICHTVYN